MNFKKYFLMVFFGLTLSQGFCSGMDKGAQAFLEKELKAAQAEADHERKMEESPIYHKKIERKNKLKIRFWHILPNVISCAFAAGAGYLIKGIWSDEGHYGLKDRTFLKLFLTGLCAGSSWCVADKLPTSKLLAAISMVAAAKISPGFPIVDTDPSDPKMIVWRYPGQPSA